MKMKTLAISVLLLAVIMAPLALAEEPAPRGPRGGQGGPRQDRGQFQGRGGFAGQPGGMMGSPFMGDGDLARIILGRMGQRLELTEEQEEQIKAIVEANKENAKTSGTAIREAMQALREATETGVEAEIIAAGKAVGDAYTEQALQRANITKQVKVRPQRLAGRGPSQQNHGLWR